VFSSNGRQVYFESKNIIKNFNVLGVHLFTHDQLFGSRQHNDAPLFEDKPTERIPEKQELITRDTSIALQIGLKSALESLVRDLFGADLQMRWSDVSYFSSS
jgi:hypothetical protein